MDFSGGSADKESTCNVGDLGLIPGLGRSPGEGNSYPLQYSGLEKSMDCIVHGVTKSQTRLSDFHFTSEAQYIQLMNSQMPGQLWAFFPQTNLTMWQQPIKYFLFFSTLFFTFIRSCYLPHCFAVLLKETVHFTMCFHLYHLNYLLESF